jgi:hypothetical protein
MKVVTATRDGSTTSNNSSSKSVASAVGTAKKLLKGKKALKTAILFCLCFLMGGAFALNLPPYVTTMGRIWRAAAASNLTDNWFGRSVFESWFADIAWPSLGFFLCLGLQLMEFVPAFPFNLSRDRARQMRYGSYLADFCVLISVYPVDVSAPNLWHVLLILIALGAVELFFYPAVLIRDA